MGKIQLSLASTVSTKKKKIQPKFYHAACLCKLFSFTAQTPPSEVTGRRQQLLVVGMERGGIDTFTACSTRKLGSRTMN